MAEPSSSKNPSAAPRGSTAGTEPTTVGTMKQGDGEFGFLHGGAGAGGAGGAAEEPKGDGAGAERSVGLLAEGTGSPGARVETGPGADAEDKSDPKRSSSPLDLSAAREPVEIVAAGTEEFLKITPDRFGGYVCNVLGQSTADGPLDPDAVIMNPPLFQEKLAAALDVWRSIGKRGIWVKVPSASTDLLSPLLKLGFKLHHAQEDYVMTNTWLPDPSVDMNLLPEYASHYVGVGGLVLNGDGDMLAITERYAFDTKKRWKLPGGLADAGESIAHAVEREVMEETGVEAQFESVICFRHNTKFLYGRSDLYMICRLRTKEPNPTITPDPKEIADACWMSREEFVANPDVYEANRAVVLQSMMHDKAGTLESARKPCTVTVGSRTIRFDLYAPDVLEDVDTPPLAEPGHPKPSL